MSHSHIHSWSTRRSRCCMGWCWKWRWRAGRLLWLQRTLNWTTSCSTRRSGSLSETAPSELRELHCRLTASRGCNDIERANLLEGFGGETPEKRRNALYTKQCVLVISIYQRKLNLVPELKTLPADDSVWIKLQKRTERRGRLCRVRHHLGFHYF